MRLLAIACIVATSACISPLEEGELGTARHFGVVRGDAPLALLPPAVDRQGNVYVLFGDTANPEVSAYIGHVRGGWSTGCEVTQGTTVGVRGWVGTTDVFAWYWSGTALVELRGDTGGCNRILDEDPTTGTELAFLGVIPHVRETSSSTTAVALVQGQSDPDPFIVVVDLTERRFAEVRPFEPAGTEDLRVVGVGADAAGNGVFLLSYEQGGATKTELRFVDAHGRQTGSVPVSAEPLATADIAGELQFGPGGLVAGLLSDGRVLRANRSGAGTELVAGMTPVGVHKHDGRVYLVGLFDGRPAATELSLQGSIAQPVPWQLSERVAATLSAGIAVLDDRSAERNYVRWNARSAIGTHPFLSAHDPRDYAVDVAGWLVAGPTYATGGISYTAVAHVPIGISYP